MVEPTSDLEEDVDEEDAPECEVCDTKLIQQADHRVVTWVDDENVVQHRHFCDDECRSAWSSPE
jgi:hypothetical protein